MPFLLWFVITVERWVTQEKNVNLDLILCSLLLLALILLRNLVINIILHVVTVLLQVLILLLKEENTGNLFTLLLNTIEVLQFLLKVLLVVLPVISQIPLMPVMLLKRHLVPDIVIIEMRYLNVPVQILVFIVVMLTIPFSLAPLNIIPYLKILLPGIPLENAFPPQVEVVVYLNTPKEKVK